MKKIIPLLILLLSLLFLTGCDGIVDADAISSAISEFEEILDGTSGTMSDTPSDTYVGQQFPSEDFLSIHLRDLEAVDFDALIAYQEAAAELPDTADLDAVSYRIVNGNVPFFSDGLKTTAEFEIYSVLDDLGRCGTAFANISPSTMPTEERGSIADVKPTGWHTAKYASVPGAYLYNRCHLIGYQLAGENANPLNLITGTRHMNINGMLGFENAIADYANSTGNHVLYAVTPVFKDDEPLARGVLMEAWSVEDNGEGISFCAFAYNIQPNIAIDYSSGRSREK